MENIPVTNINAKNTHRDTPPVLTTTTTTFQHADADADAAATAGTDNDYDDVDEEDFLLAWLWVKYLLCLHPEPPKITSPVDCHFCQ